MHVPGSVFWVAYLAMFLDSWTGVLVWALLLLYVWDSYHFKSGDDCGLNSSLSFLPQCVIGMSLGSSMSRGLARHISPRLPFLDFLFRVLSSISLAGNETFMKQNPFSHLELQYLLTHTRVLNLNFSGDLVALWSGGSSNFCLIMQISSLLMHWHIWGLSGWGDLFLFPTYLNFGKSHSWSGLRRSLLKGRNYGVCSE